MDMINRRYKQIDRISFKDYMKMMLSLKLYEIAFLC